MRISRKTSEYGLTEHTMTLRSTSVVAASQTLQAATSSCCGDSSAPTSSRTRSNSDTVVGGVIGGVVFLILVVAVGIHIMLSTGLSRRQQRRQVYAIELRTPDTRAGDSATPLSGYSGSSKQRTILYLCSVCATRFPGSRSGERKFRRNIHCDTVGCVSDIENVDYIGFVEDSPDGGRKVPKSPNICGSQPNQLGGDKSFNIRLHCHHCNCDFCQLDNLDCLFSVNLDRNPSKGLPPHTDPTQGPW